MAKDDWPESTEAGVLVDEAYRKGWLPRDMRQAPKPDRPKRVRRKPAHDEH